ncbi:hypothetical protein [Marinomonas sp. GJ51-6]|uniref:hypothetical protein n=1 Tax=Marinomonas sp. GJ51-6 TaxID=2992802 RepID=UPI0029345CD5|nr:hypothetical protein [Marinomonas sp. GJ51-6]WOD06929.1 hypothetical protein ONZ50_14980 [Marinomonas sp. GJ51-6]
MIAADGSGSLYLENNNTAKREQEIYDEVNRRTEEAPFTVLFTGNIPEKIQEKRLRMMPEIGAVDQGGSDPLNPSLEIGGFSPVGQGVNSSKNSNASAKELEKLDALIGG